MRNLRVGLPLRGPLTPALAQGAVRTGRPGLVRVGLVAWLLPGVVAYGAGAVPPTPKASVEGMARLTAEDVLGVMLNSQANLVGYTADASVRVKIGRVTLPQMPIRVTVRRPSDVTIKFLTASVKPRYPLFPDPVMLSKGAYTLTLSEETTQEGYHCIEAAPSKGADSPYHLNLWVGSGSGLLEKARLSLPTGEATTLTARYRKLGVRCWVPEEIWGTGAMLVKDILPLAPVEWALKLVRDPSAVEFHAVFTNIVLIR